MLETIIGCLVSVAPSLTAVIGCIITFIKSKAINQIVVNKFEELKEEVISTKEFNELKSQLLIVHQENIELKKTINELLTKIDKVER